MSNDILATASTPPSASRPIAVSSVTSREMIGALDVLLDERTCIHYAAPSTSFEQLLPYGIEIARGHVEFVL